MNIPVVYIFYTKNALFSQYKRNNLLALGRYMKTIINTLLFFIYPVENCAPSHFGLLHEIFVLDAHLEEPLDESNHKSITTKLISSLLTSLRMEELGPLQIYPATDLRAPGWSFIQPITTSHISGHYFEKPGRLPHIRMDFYSCCSVNWMNIIKVVNDHLNMADWRATFLDRQIEPDAERRIIDIAGHGDHLTYEAPMIAGEDVLMVAAKVKQDHMKENG